MNYDLRHTIIFITLSASVLLSAFSAFAQNTKNIHSNFYGIWSSQNCTDDEADFLFLTASTALSLKSNKARKMDLLIGPSSAIADVFPVKLDKKNSGFIGLSPENPDVLQVKLNPQKLYEQSRAVELFRPQEPQPLIDEPEEYLALIDDLRQAVQVRPDDTKGLELLVNAEARLGNFGAASRVQDQLIAAFDDNVPAYAYSTKADLMVLAAGGYVSLETQGVLIQALERDAHDGTALYYWGLMASQNGRPDIAFDIFDQLLKDSPAGAPWIQPIRNQIEDISARKDEYKKIDAIVQSEHTEREILSRKLTLEDLFSDYFEFDNFLRCQRLPPRSQALYGEIVSVLNNLDNAKVPCEGETLKCTEALFSAIDIHADGVLQIAEISRVLRVLMQIDNIERYTVSARRQSSEIVESIVLAPLAAQALVSSYDYDGDKALSLDEVKNGLLQVQLLDMPQLLDEAVSQTSRIVRALD